MKMNIFVFVINFLISYSQANTKNDLIIHYFRFKEVSTVVGYTCNSIEDDVAISTYFSSIGISVAIAKLKVNSTVNKFAEASYWKVGIFLDLNCYSGTEEIVSAFATATEHRMFDELHSWMVIGNNLNDTLQIVNDKAFGISTDFVIARPSKEDENSYEIYDVYNAAKGRGGKLNVTFLGNWSIIDGMKVTLNQIKFQRRSNLCGLTLRISFYKTAYKTDNVSLEEYLQDYSTAPKEGLSRFGFVLMMHMSDLFNFKITCKETPAWKAGDKKGSIVRSLSGDDFDMTGSVVSLTVPRSYWITFVHQSWPFRTCFIFRNPQPKNIKVSELLRPFAAEVWYLLFVFLLANMMLLAVVSHWDWNERASARLFSSFIVTLGALCQQSTSMRITFVSTRIAFLSLMTFALLIYNYYSAKVVSARLNEPILKINDSLNQMRKLPLKMASENMNYLDFFLRQPGWDAEQFYNTTWVNIPESERIMEPELGVKLLRKGGFAYHLHPDVGYPIIEKTFSNREICELMEVHLARLRIASFAVPLNSSIVEIMRVGFMRISEVGLRKRQVKKWQYRKIECRKDVLSVSSITMDEFLPHLILLAIGVTLASLICIIEITKINWEKECQKSLRHFPNIN